MSQTLACIYTLHACAWSLHDGITNICIQLLSCRCMHIMTCTYKSYFDNSECIRIIEHPQSQSKTYGDEVTLSVSIEGPDALSYQWIKDDILIADDSALANLTRVTTDTLHISSLLPEHVGSYKWLVSNQSGSLESDAAELTGNFRF